jgi:aminoglycoside phosphotransferase
MSVVNYYDADNVVEIPDDDNVEGISTEALQKEMQSLKEDADSLKKLVFDLGDKLDEIKQRISDIDHEPTDRKFDQREKEADEENEANEAEEAEAPSCQRTYSPEEVEERLRTGKPLSANDLVVRKGCIEQDGKFEPGGWCRTVGFYLDVIRRAS